MKDELKLLRDKEAEYFERFGVAYYLDMSESLTNKEMIEQINECLKKNKVKKVEYDKDVLY